MLSRRVLCSPKLLQRYMSSKAQPDPALMQNIRIEPFTHSNKNDALQLLLKSFIRDEPMMHSLGVTEYQAKPILESLFLETAVKDEISFLAYDKRTEQVVCAYIGSLHRRGDVHDDYTMNDVTNPMIYTMDFLDIVGSGIWQILPNNINVFCKNDIASIHPDYRGQKLFRTLKNMCNEKAQQLGCKYAVSLATSYQTQMLNEKLNFRTHRFINYCDYRVLGKTVFANVPAPHTCAKLMIKKYEVDTENNLW